MSKSIIVCQIGSRHRYIIPEVLEKMGLLHRLYTDSTCFSFLGRVASFAKLLGIKSNSVQRLCVRNPKIPRSKLYSTDILFLKEQFLKIHAKDSLELRFCHYSGMENMCISWGLGSADCVYGMYFENFEFLKYAKRKGLKVVVDIYETPMTYRYLIEEIRSNAEYEVFREDIPKYQFSHQVRMHYMEDLLSLADRYTIPSQFVKDSLCVFKSYDPAKAILLPYASSATPIKYSYSPRKHRIIWVGNDPIRKGLIYYARAAVELKRIYPDVDCRVIGVIDPRLKTIFPFSELNYVGVVDKKQIMEEFSSAEAYVFPTLFEGFAGTIIEAASCGCPIITTPCSGADTSEFPAIFVPKKDVTSIVRNVSCLFEDKSLQLDISRRLFEYAKCLMPGAYAKNLIAVFKDI